jgi:hypothetical protein
MQEHNDDGREDQPVEDAQVTVDPDLAADEHHEPTDRGAAPEHEDDTVEDEHLEDVLDEE